MQRKILLAFITLLLIGVLITGVLALSFFRVEYSNGVEDSLESKSMLIKEFLILHENESKLDFEKIATMFSKRANARVTFIDSDGWVVGDSDTDIKELENHGDRPEVKKAFEGEVGVSRRYSDTLNSTMIYVAVLFEDNTDGLSIIRLSMPLEDLNNINRTMLEYIVISIVAGLLVAFLLGFRYVKTVTDPIKQLTNATKEIAQGNYGEKVYLKTEDELGILTENFNLMSMKLSDTINQLQDSNTKMRATLSSMINGLIALDNSKKIMFINPTAEEMFNLKEDDVKGKHILKVIRNNILDDLIQKLIKNNISSKNEIEIYEPTHRILNIYSNPIRLSYDSIETIGVLILIQDVTEIRKLERMRTDFVANVSHELKTPLTSIVGFIETLKDGAAENEAIRNKFLDIMDIEAKRLTFLIQDILLLSEIENKNSVLKQEKIDVSKSIHEVNQFLEGLANQKSITIVEKVEENLPNIYGSIGWFKQMLINLIENSIKYTPNGGEIRVIVYSERKNLIIKIIDNGLGIDKEHITRIFERFYRVDKARTRQIGGTGLGLAIVKHIVISFKGEIEVQSEINTGTEFKITLPIKK